MSASPYYCQYYQDPKNFCYRGTFKFNTRKNTRRKKQRTISTGNLHFIQLPVFYCENMIEYVKPVYHMLLMYLQSSHWHCLGYCLVE